MERFHAEPMLADLKDFQRATVEHITNRFYRDPNPSRRFLVADETGLGKSVVARGVIARCIEHLQDDDSVDRIDIVYVCSNSDIAEQNIKRLAVPGQQGRPINSRLTMLAVHARQLAEATAERGKPVNLVSFTPGTSFEMGWRTGKSEERALLHILLAAELGLKGRDERWSRRLLQGGVQKLTSFDGTINWLEKQIKGPVDPQIAKTFVEGAERKGLINDFTGLMEDCRGKHSVPSEVKSRLTHVVAGLRTELARASVETLEPDLVILDEFQRFRHLLDIETGGEAAELAHNLFDYKDSRVLLLSATPFKPYTLAEETETGDDHKKDFGQTLSFLATQSPLAVESVDADLRTFRSRMINGEDTTDLVDSLRERLLLVMSRTERPRLGEDGMLQERTLPVTTDANELLGYVALQQLSKHVDGAMSVEYWKSAPYFAQFMDGYDLGRRVDNALKDAEESPAVRALLAAAPRVDADDVRGFRPVDPGSGRLRALAADTVDQGWWQLLWVPPSMPYLEPAGPYAEPWAQSMTKRLVFSSWAATPTAVASLLSYEASRQLAAGSRLIENSAEARASFATRTDYRLDGQRPAAMSTLALFWPHPSLALIGDPLELARQSPETSISAADAETGVAAVLATRLPTGLVGPGPDGSQWRSFFAWPGALPTSDIDASRLRGGLDGSVVSQAISQDESDNEPRDDASGLNAHVDAAMAAISDIQPADSTQDDVAGALAQLACHSPGNIAYRAVMRVTASQAAIGPEARWIAAATIANGLRTLFNRPESVQALDRLAVGGEPYWQTVLRYCAAGNLQSVLDEYLHHLSSETPGDKFDETALYRIANTARQSLSMRGGSYEATDPLNPPAKIRFLCRFALRYGGRRDDQESARQPRIRQAFNSPFWPFVLASTSVGQEGIDFHWWCHSLVHWNVPANPVDFEQREGRVNRFGGHAVRRNIAARHRSSALASHEADPWKAAYDAARDESQTLGEFAPYWMYPGPHKIERILLPYPLSRDQAKAQSLKDDLAVYRLTFGQPRQEDLVDLLKRRNVSATSAQPLNLRP